MLFEWYKNVNYIIHGHVYVDGAKVTEHKYPCGSLNEVLEIIHTWPNNQAANFAVNLLGHGCLLMAEDLEFLESHSIDCLSFS